MSARLSKLEALLARIQHNGAQARSSAAATYEMTAEDLTLDSPSLPPPADQNHFSVQELDEPDLEMSDAPDSLGLDEVPESGPMRSGIDRDLVDEEDAPITPPPESVEEATPPQRRQSVQPTIEQVGHTVDLDESDAPSSLELDEPIIPSEVAEPISVEMLSAEPAAAIGESPLQTPAMELPRIDMPERGQDSVEPVTVQHVAQRAQSAGSPLVVEGTRRRQQATSFGELLDLSLSL